MAGLLASKFDTPQPSTATIPAANGVLLLDSRFRSSSASEQPTNFISKISAALEVKKTYYRELYWNQPLYTHNLTNNLLIFELGDTDLPEDSRKFCVLARPWYSYTSHDGNPPGSVFLLPQGNSYAAAMEYALNNDVRKYTDLTKPADSQALVPLYKAFWDILGPAYSYVDIYFRYSSVKGFCMYAKKTLDQSVVPIRLLDCNYISNGYGIHGFGRFSFEQKKYLPSTDTFNDAVYSTGIPNLLVDKFLVITSDTLAKNRRGKSYSSSYASGFSDEVAVLNLDKNLTGIFHAKVAGEDTTTLDARFGVGPQEIHISMLDSKGVQIECSNVMDAILKDTSHLSYFSAPWSPIDFALPNFGGSRASPGMMNYLTFGTADLWVPAASIITPNQYQSNRDYSFGPSDAKMLVEDVIHVITAVALTS